MSSIIPIKCEPQNILLNEYIKQEYNDESTENDYGTDGKSIYNWSMQDFKYTTENVEIQNIKIEAEIIDDEVCKRENHNVSSNNMCHVSTAYDIKNEPVTCNLGIKAPSTINLIPPKHKVISCKKKQYSSQNKLSVNKPYRCKICEKSFSLKGSLKTHIWIHMQEKPYKCFICNKSFSQASTLITHKIIHNFDKPFNCDICKKSYAQKVNLKMHMMSHLSEKLSISNKTFSQKEYMHTDKITHSIEDP
uniref:Zinc finger protein n=1 Tax=Schizaphis graminum TaxID=13262 RepID=A0A2S2P182_SCHGA